jgi:NAD+ kinase
MNRFCIIQNSDKENIATASKCISESLSLRGKESVILPNVMNVVNQEVHYTDTDLIPDDMECAIVLGGDGTVIQAAIDLVKRDIPMLAVNLGTVGYLTEVNMENIEDALDRLINDEFKIEERIMLKSHINDREFHALNDVVLFKNGSNRIITLDVYVNDRLMDTYCADGIIIATPTGSTGYNLSSGGPVMDPHTKATVITPICPHSLNKRSIVLSSDDKIRIIIGKTKENVDDTANMIADGREITSVKTGDEIMVTVPDEVTRLIKLSDEGFYERMRVKLKS